MDTPRRLKPPALTKDDLIAVVAPASHPSPEDLEAGIRCLESAGFHVENMVAGPQLGYLSGTDADRVRLLNTALGRADIRAVICARGGYGTTRIMRSVDFKTMRSDPKLITGYSDITALQLATLAITGAPSVSGSMVAVDWPRVDEAESRQFRAILSGTAVEGLFSTDGISLRGKRDGAVRGQLVGGNLTILCRLVGTPYLPDMRGCILFLEDVGEAPYRVDGLFSQLELSGILGQVGGLVLGSFTEASPPPGSPSLELQDVLEHYIERCSCPVAAGLPYGHIENKLAIPIGVEGELSVDGTSARLRVLEQVTARA